MRLCRSALASPLEDQKGDHVNTYIKSFSVAALMTVLPALAPHFTQAQSASPIIDCNNQNTALNNCPPPIYKSVPALPVVNNNLSPPPAAINTSPPLQPMVGVTLSPQNQQSGWQYDPRLHRRQHHRDAVFQFSFGGFFYDQPYWQHSQRHMRFSGINCTQGRNIVASSGYNHVRDIACDGMTYTYRAHRFNHNYVVSVNSRRGAISSATQF